MLGLGVSHAPSVAARGGTYARPLATMRAYLDRMDSAPYTGHEPEQPVERLLAALGPRMLDLAAERTAGAHPYFVPVEHTAFARERRWGTVLEGRWGRRAGLALVALLVAVWVARFFGAFGGPVIG